MEEDLGYGAILKLFSMVRLRGVVDTFGALLAGAVSSILPERSKLTLSEFGYYALFTTSMDSVSSWTDARVKIIAMVSNGRSGKEIEAFPGARQRLAKLLIQLYERQIQYESDTMTRKLNIEDKVLGQQRFDPETGLSSDLAHTTLFSSKTGSQITRYSLCLTDLYHLEGMHQDALASFLNACMIASKCFADIERLDRRIWAAYTHAGLAPMMAPQTIVPSQGGPLPGPPFTGSADIQVTPFSTHPVLSGMSNGVGAPGQVGLGLSPSFQSQPPLSEMSVTGMIHSSPGLPQGPNNTPQGLPGGPASTQPLQPSTFALRAIESCIYLNEPLASVAMQQFLPRMDYNQAYTTIRAAHEQGFLTFSGKALSAVPSGMNGTSVLGPLGAIVGPVTRFLSGTGPVAPSPNGSTVPGAMPGVPASPRVQSSSSVFTPEVNTATDHLTISRRASTFPGHSLFNTALGGGAALTQVRSPLRIQGGSLPRQQFLDLLFDLSLLELISHLCREKKDSQGLLKVQARINNNRMALDARPALRDQIRHTIQQDLLTRLWSKYARVG
ncbi:hypothetical protein BGX34_010491 [Mortierella sp. NVP85]|nr:hypothetical protein BGX34_010491 [Mortierella sp. NVP85]